MEVINNRLDLQHLVSQNFEYHEENGVLMNSHQLLVLASLVDPKFKCIGPFIVSPNSIFCFAY